MKVNKNTFIQIIGHKYKRIVLKRMFSIIFDI